MAVVSFAQAPNLRAESTGNEVEMLMPVIAEVFANIGITKDDVGFICSGSTDYLMGGPFSFVMALDAVGVWPPRSESHVEMDGAWALYEAWVACRTRTSTPPSSTASASPRSATSPRSWPSSSTPT